MPKAPDKLFFVLGSHPGISVAEIRAVLALSAETPVWYSPELMVVEIGDRPVDVAALMAQLGGTIKIGRVSESPVAPGPLAAYIHSLMRQRPVFGISQYSLGRPLSKKASSAAFRELVRLGMETKRHLKESGVPSRFVRPSQGLSLNSASVFKNRLLEEGAELVVLRGERAQLGITEAIQPFEEFAEIDYGRPARDTKQGMLPPKLARIMLNLADVTDDTVVWDPFCGSGTVLTEAMRLGVHQGYGSDLNPQAVDDSRENLAWTRHHYPDRASGQFAVSQGDAREPGSDIKENGIDRIVAEGYLGPPREGRESRGELERHLNEITSLIEQSLLAWKHPLKPGGQIVLALPAYVWHDGRDGRLEPQIMVTEPRLPEGYVWDPLIDGRAADHTGAELTSRGGLLYGRPNQLVWRELVRIKRK
jgi:tRNA G10  N-methylase Trm11